MGLLAAGIGGAADEYLSQRKEERAADEQRVRDERLQEFQRSNIKYQAELGTQEAIRKEGVLSKAAEIERKHESDEKDKDRKLEEKLAPDGSFTLGRGQKRFNKEGELIAEGEEFTHAPSAASNAAEQTLYRMGPNGEKGAATTFELLTTQYYKDPNIWEKKKFLNEFDQEVEIEVLKEGSPGLMTYANQNLQPDSRIYTEMLESINADPDRMWDYARTQPQFQMEGGIKNAIAYIRSIHGQDWKPNYGPGAAEGSNEGTMIPEPGEVKVPFKE